MSPRLGIHLQLGNGLLKAAERAGAIGAETVQVFADNPTAWKRRLSSPAQLPAFRARLAEHDVRPVAIHASYLVNLAGPEPAFWQRSIDVLASELRAATGYGASFVNVHTGSHRDTSLEIGIQRIAEGIVHAFERAEADEGGDPPVLVLENAAGGGWSIGSTVEELALVVEAAARRGVPERRLGICLDTAHAWGAGIGLDEPDEIDGLLERFDRELGIGRLILVHLNDSRSERGSRHDRHEHVGAGRIGVRGLRHLLRHPMLSHAPFIMETPGMHEGYDAINLERARAILAGDALAELPPEAFDLGRNTAAVAPPE